MDRSARLALTVARLNVRANYAREHDDLLKFRLVQRREHRAGRIVTWIRSALDGRARPVV